MTDNDWIGDLDWRTARKKRTIKKRPVQEQSGKKKAITRNRQVAVAIKLVGTALQDGPACLGAVLEKTGLSLGATCPVLNGLEQVDQVEKTVNGDQSILWQLKDQQVSATELANVPINTEPVFLDRDKLVIWQQVPRNLAKRTRRRKKSRLRTGKEMVEELDKLLMSFQSQTTDELSSSLKK